MTWDNIWEESFIAEIGSVEERTGTNPMDWRVAGSATKAWPDKENKAWWDENGRKMFFDFINMWQGSGMEIWQSPTGVSGVEIEFNNYFGKTLIKAFADLVAVTPDGEIVVIDFKTGKSTPDSSMQLGIYASLMEMQFGIRPTKGYYYSARKAEWKESPGLERWTIGILTELFSKFETAIENEIFLPNVGMGCGTCGVRDYCYAQGGQLAELYDPLADKK